MAGYYTVSHVGVVWVIHSERNEKKILESLPARATPTGQANEACWLFQLAAVEFCL